MSLNLRDLYCDLKNHVNHDIEVATYGANGYGEFANIAIECMECGVVLLDADYHEPHEGHIAPEFE